jgi:hypothetical protein
MEEGNKINNDTRLESGYERFTGIKYSTDTGLLTSTQNEFSHQWLYNTPYVMNQPVKNREHARLLLASIDENLDWVTFHTLDNPILFAQAGWCGKGFSVVEVNVPQGGWVQRILRSGQHEISDIASENFGNPEMLEANEQYTAAEAFMLCSLWMDRQMIPEGYTFGPIEK